VLDRYVPGPAAAQSLNTVPAAAQP